MRTGSSTTNGRRPAPAWDGTPVWVHTDLLRPNLLVRDGRLCAVIDFGGAGVGDPAADVIAFALHQAALIIPYYAETNPGFVAPAKRTVEEILADAQAAG
jgi:aminoglycoside phosphotransferase (APT) family kinase protein